jgi:maltooligosyltrehalose trehalohydrolase
MSPPENTLLANFEQLCHDISNPLMVVSGNAHLLERQIQRITGISETERDYLMTELSDMKKHVQAAVSLMDHERRRVADHAASDAPSAPEVVEGMPALGAHVTPDGVQFAVWASAVDRVEVMVEEGDATHLYPLHRTAEGLHVGAVPGLRAGARYRYRLDEEHSFPDPASRFQPEGVHGVSEVIDPATFAWTDTQWRGLDRDRLIIYEIHVGTYTPEGTFAALKEQLLELAHLGVTAIELMPIADFPGRWNWGYDGVAWWAPSRAYGRPDDLRRLVDEAHHLGIGVILDVVYNHFGPEGAYWRAFSPEYFTDRHVTPWGDAINFDGPGSAGVREFVIQNAVHWIREYHIDGLRLDATHHLRDESSPHILAELAERVRAAAAPRPIILIAEDERNDVRLIRPRDAGGYGLDGVWADDFHHAMRVLLTGERDSYFADFSGTTEELARCLNGGFLYQGQAMPRSGEPRGTTVTDEPGSAFVLCTQNHDQVGNRAFGDRLGHQIAHDRSAVAAAILLFAPVTPLLFMGQEFNASSPFLFFTDFGGDLGHLVTEGRRGEFAAFRAFADHSMRDSIPDPQEEGSFLASKLPLEERQAQSSLYNLYRRLLALRRDDPVLARPARERTRATPVGAQIVVVHRWSEDEREHRVLVANFGAASELPRATTSGLQDVPEGEWRQLLSTADATLGDAHVAYPTSEEDPERIRIPARSAVIFAVTPEGVREAVPSPS